MSIATEIARIQGDKSTISTKLQELGLAEPSSGLDDLAAAVDGIANCSAVSATVKEGETYTIPRGYHNGSGTVSGVTGGGNYSLQSKQATPTKSQQSVTPDAGYYGLSDVTVAAIPPAYQDVTPVTAAAGDVLANKIIVDASGKQVPGTMPNNGSASATLDAETTSYSIAKGYHDGTGTVSVSIEQRSVTPTGEQQVVEPSDGKLLSQVTVAAIPSSYRDTSDATVTAGSMLSGTTAYGPDGKVTGTIPSKGELSGTIDGMQAEDYKLAAGYYTGGSVTLTDSVETALAAI